MVLRNAHEGGGWQRIVHERRRGGLVLLVVVFVVCCKVLSTVVVESTYEYVKKLRDYNNRVMNKAMVGGGKTKKQKTTHNKTLSKPKKLAL